MHKKLATKWKKRTFFSFFDAETNFEWHGYRNCPFHSKVGNAYRYARRIIQLNFSQFLLFLLLYLFFSFAISWQILSVSNLKNEEVTNFSWTEFDKVFFLLFLRLVCLIWSQNIDFYSWHRKFVYQLLSRSNNNIAIFSVVKFNFPQKKILSS